MVPESQLVDREEGLQYQFLLVSGKQIEEVVIVKVAGLTEIEPLIPDTVVVFKGLLLL